MTTTQSDAYEVLARHYSDYRQRYGNGFYCPRGGCFEDVGHHDALAEHVHRVHVLHDPRIMRDDDELVGGMTSDEQYREDKAGFGEY